MSEPVSEATARFLESVRADLQLQLSLAGEIRELRVTMRPVGTRLIAMVDVAGRTVELVGTGDSLLTAYADLRRHTAEPMLATAYRAILET